MSRKTVVMGRKVAQAKAKGKTIRDLLPTGRAISTGKKTFIKHVEKDDDGGTKAVRQKGIASGKVGTEPMKTSKAEKLSNRFR